ncbi:hypothetical protein D3C86_936830 [compost metagenome]
MPGWMSSLRNAQPPGGDAVSNRPPAGDVMETTCPLVFSIRLPALNDTSSPLTRSTR